MNGLIEKFREASEAFGGGLKSDFMPCLRIFEQNKIRHIERLANTIQSDVEQEFERHKQTFDPGSSLRSAIMPLLQNIFLFIVSIHVQVNDMQYTRCICR